MVKVKSVFGEELSGQIGKAGVYAKWKGIQYRRKYTKPANPKTPAQMKNRGVWANGVDKWHTFNPLQAQAYTPLASGQPMSGYNLFMSRWMKMNDAGRSAYVSPYVGFKQVSNGAATGSQTASTTSNTREVITSNKPIVRGSVTYTKSSGTFDPVAVVDIARGRIDVIKEITGAITISYESQGKVVTDEVLQTDAEVEDIIYTEMFPIDYKSVVLKVAGSEVHALEMDVNAGKFYVEGISTFTGGSTINFSKFIPAVDVKLELMKANTNFNTFRDYSDVNGEIQIAQSSEDGDRDMSYTSPDYSVKIAGGVSAVNSAKDELVVLTSI